VVVDSVAVAVDDEPMVLVEVAVPPATVMVVVWRVAGDVVVEAAFPPDNCAVPVDCATAVVVDVIVADAAKLADVTMLVVLPGGV